MKNGLVSGIAGGCLAAGELKRDLASGDHQSGFASAMPIADSEIQRTWIGRAVKLRELRLMVVFKDGYWP